ncbi:NADH-quinone oxidoreductase subunit C [bacterium]|nr:NADH-quinone oxidoreductase subunit C [bacterium]
MNSAAISAKVAGAIPGACVEALEFQGQTTLQVRRESLKEVLAFLRDDPDILMNQLLDVTAVDYPARADRFDVVYILASIREDGLAPVRVRIKTRIPDGAALPSVTDLWRSADWGERECFDMFGIRFEGHPNLKRILNPDNFYGYPLRKTFPLRGERDPAFLEYKETEPA